MKQDQILQCHQKECEGCSFKEHWDKLKTPHADGWGPTPNDFYVLGSHMTEADDSFGHPFAGAHGKFIINLCNLAKLPSPRMQHIVRTFPNGNKTTWRQVESCRPSVERDILAAKPKVVVTIGEEPLKWIEPSGSPTLWEGKPFAAQIADHHFWVVPCLDLADAFNQKNPARKEVQAEMLRTFKTVKMVLDSYPPAKVHQPEELDKYANIYFDATKLEKDIESFDPDYETIVFDTETTGLSLNNEKLLTLAFTIKTKKSDSPFAIHTFGVPIYHPEFKISDIGRDGLILYLRDLFAKFKTKTCHNALFDLAQLYHIFGEEVFKYNIGDTLAMSYSLDTHLHIHKLDICARLHLGIPNFKDSSDVDVANLKNAPVGEVLQYNCRDSTVTWLLAIKLAEKLKLANLETYYQFHLQRIIPVCLMARKGVPLNVEEIQSQFKRVNAEVTLAWDKIMEDDMVKDWNANHPEPFDILSPFQVKKMLVQHQIIAPGSSTRYEALQDIKLPVVQTILEYRSLVKRQAFFEELAQRGDRAYSNFNHTGARTGRLSSSKINLQNIEKGDPRAIIQAPRGFILFSLDFKQLEASIIADAAKDKYLMNAIRNGLDIHAETARELVAAHPPLGGKNGIVLNDPAKFDKLRYMAKNGWVFPAFYLASAYSLASYMNIPTKKAETYLDTFWKRYSGVRKWQQEMVMFYKTNGYIISPTGRRIIGILSPNDLANYPIQGSASDIVIAAQERLAFRDIVPNVQVHDELVFVLPRPTADSQIKEIVDTVLIHPNKESPVKAFDWLQTPLTIEGKVGINWGPCSETNPRGMKKIGAFTANWS